MKSTPFRPWVLAGLFLAMVLVAGPSWSAKESPRAVPRSEEIFEELDRLKEELRRLLKDLDLGNVSKKEALKVVVRMRATLQELKSRLGDRLWKERPGSPNYRLLNEALVALDRLDRWLGDLQRRWEAEQRSWI